MHHLVAATASNASQYGDAKNHAAILASAAASDSVEPTCTAFRKPGWLCAGSARPHGIAVLARGKFRHELIEHVERIGLGIEAVDHAPAHAASVDRGAVQLAVAALHQIEGLGAITVAEFM